MRYAVARIEKENRDTAYRIYLTDALKAIGGLNVRYADLINSDVKEEANPEEIKNRLLGKIGELNESVRPYGKN